MKNKRKQGENEALQILKLKGYCFDEKYSDDNSINSMPDLKYLNEEHYLEVTHTLHNNSLVKNCNNFDKKPIEEQLKIRQQASEALHRIHQYDYSSEDKGDALIKNDLKILKAHLGYDLTKFNDQLSEFQCDSPIIECSTDNILREVYEKGKKHNKGNTDLFIFVLNEEFSLLCDLIRSEPYNGWKINFFKAIQRSPFRYIFICAWNFDTQTYEIENPDIIKLAKMADYIEYQKI